MQRGIWERVDPGAITPAPAVAQAGTTAASSAAASTRWTRWEWRIANALATVVWLYAICKVFIVDIDLLLLQRIWPAGSWLVTYRFFILLAIASALALVFRKWVFFAWAAYFALFPIIVVVWWLPRAIYKSRSWVVLLAVLHVLTTFIQDFRYSLITKSAALIAIALILVNPNRSLTIVCGAAVLVLLLTTYARTVAIVLQPSRFVAGQQRAIDKFVGSKALTDAWALSEELKDPGIDKFDESQLTKFTTAIGTGVVAHRALYFWAYQLDSYRKGSMPNIFNLLSYLWLFIQTVIGFAFLNLAVYDFDHNAFSYRNTPQLFDFFHYTINLILPGSVGGLEAKSQLAIALADLARFSGLLFLVTILATFVLSLKQSRQDDQMKESIARIKARGRQFESEFENQYEVSIAEAIDRLRELPGIFVRIAAWLSRQIPQDFEQ
jgi:hypothetical protein